MFNKICCGRKFNNKKSFTNHRRWHNIPKYVKFHKSFRKKLRISHLGNNNPMWKERGVGFFALHQWVERNKPKISLCEKCKSKPPYDLANISGLYKRDINDFQRLCRRCHMKKDGRLNQLIIRNKQGLGKHKK